MSKCQIVFQELNCIMLIAPSYLQYSHSFNMPIYIADIHDCRLNIDFVNISAAISLRGQIGCFKKVICPFAKLFVYQRVTSTKSLPLNILRGKSFFGKIFSAKCESFRCTDRHSKTNLTAQVYLEAVRTGSSFLYV